MKNARKPKTLRLILGKRLTTRLLSNWSEINEPVICCYLTCYLLLVSHEMCLS